MKRKRNHLLLSSTICIGSLFFIIFLFQLKIFIVDYTIIPMQNGINHIGSYVNDIFDFHQNNQKLQTENQDLQTQLAELKSEHFFLQKEEKELDDLRKLREVDEQYPNYNKTGANVIYKKPESSLYNTFLIDKGSRDGIAVNMNVLTYGGLVGIITETGQNWSFVQSIIDDNSNVGAEVTSTTSKCIVEGNADYAFKNGIISFQVIGAIDQKELDINKGDQIVTSDISNKYLPGILIGYINNISTDSNHMTISGQLTPSVDFKHINKVLVITDLK